MFSPFKYVKCFVDNKGRKVITWQFNKGILHKATTLLYIQVSLTGSLWYTISLNIIDKCLYIDPNRYWQNKLYKLFYRLKLSVLNLLYFSLICQAGSGMPRGHRARFNNIIRLAAKLLLKTGRKGLFLKRKTFGIPCSACKDFYNDNSANLHCSICLGTGILGGYYLGIPFYILPLKDQLLSAITLVGVINGLVVSCRCIAWPFILHGDIWIDKYNDNRYYIDSVTPASSYMHVPVMASMTMHLILKSDVVHLISKPETQSYNIDWLLDFKVK